VTAAITACTVVGGMNVMFCGAKRTSDANGMAATITTLAHAAPLLRRDVTAILVLILLAILDLLFFKTMLFKTIHHCLVFGRCSKSAYKQRFTPEIHFWVKNLHRKLGAIRLMRSSKPAAMMAFLLPQCLLSK
jgi:hypothetical protein